VRLRKQAPAKAAIVALTAGLFMVVFQLVRADPRIPATAAAPPSAPDFDRFFAPDPSSPPPTPIPDQRRPHTRTRAS